MGQQLRTHRRRRKWRLSGAAGSRVAHFSSTPGADTLAPALPSATAAQRTLREGHRCRWFRDKATSEVSETGTVS
uniref:Uncharacterized protein n=1 Tax=Knipowitschia caucasica TaxID=637954 RepID=A0AAV2LWC3_KNICA